MNKSILLLLVFCLLQVALKAQTNEAEAKASYLLAEENYNAGNYNAALSYLENTEKTLGTTNCKILYLKISIESEIYKTNPDHYSKLMSSITKFQSHPGVTSFTQEKVLEIAKLKLILQEEVKMRATEKEVKEQYFRNYSFEGWPIGSEFSELRKTHVNESVFTLKKMEELSYGEVKNCKLYQTNKTIYGIKDGAFRNGANYPNNLQLPTHNFYFVLLNAINNEISGIILDQNVVKGYRKMIYLHCKEGKGLTYFSNTSLSAIEALNGTTNIINKLSEEFGFYPKALNCPKDSSPELHNIYEWNKDEKSVRLYLYYFKDDTKFVCYIIQDVIEH